jgi:hypothetical protein
VFICYRAPNQIFVILFERNYCGGRIELFWIFGEACPPASRMAISPMPDRTHYCELQWFNYFIIMSHGQFTHSLCQVMDFAILSSLLKRPEPDLCLNRWLQCVVLVMLTCRLS